MDTAVPVQQLCIRSHEFDGGQVVALEGELDVVSAQQLAAHLQAAAGSLIVVDLHGLSFMDSSGIGTIHSARQKAIAEGGYLVVCRPGPMVHRVLQITGLDTWIAEWNPFWSAGSEGEEASATIASASSQFPDH